MASSVGLVPPAIPKRQIGIELDELLDSTVLFPFFAVELLFDSPNQLYFWSGYGDLVNDGKTYTGAGDLMKVAEVKESADLGAYGTTLSMSGIPGDLLDLALAEPYQGRLCRVLFGLLNQDLTLPSALLTEADEFLTTEAGERFDLSVTQPAFLFELFVGYMDVMDILTDGSTMTVTLAVESKLIDLERPRVRRYNNASQQSRFPGDLAFEFVERIQSEDRQWTVT